MGLFDLACGLGFLHNGHAVSVAFSAPSAEQMSPVLGLWVFYIWILSTSSECFVLTDSLHDREL